MKKLILHINSWLSAHKGAAALILVVLLALSLASALRLNFQEDISAFLPQKPSEEGQEKVAVLFEGGSLDQRLDAMFAFEDVWNQANPDLPIQAQADESQLLEQLNTVTENWPFYLEPVDYVRMDSLLRQPDYIARSLQEGKERLIGGNALVARYLRNDPLNLFTPVLQRLQDQHPETRMEEGCLFTANGETGILFFDSPYGASESANNALLVKQLTAAKEAVMAQYPELVVTSTGGPEVAVENSSRIKKDAFMALAIAALLICIVLWFSYKRVSDVLWILIAIASGALFALGLIAIFKSEVSVIVLGIGCTIIGIAVNYPLHYVDHLKYQPDKRKALADQVNPLLVGNITTVGAFLSLLLLKAEALHDFGFIGAMMLVGTIIFVLVFMPVFVPAATKPRNAIKLDLDRYLNPGKTTRTITFGLFLALTVVFVIMGQRVGFEANLHNINYMTPAQARGFQLLESLQPAGIANASESARQEALDQWNQFWQSHPEVREELAAKAPEAGFTATAFQPFFDSLDKEYTVQVSPSYATTLVQSLSEDFDTIGLLCSLIVFIFLWISFGSLELSILSFLPLAVSWLWIQGIMGLTGLQFNIVNIILATFIFGQGDDYTIFITEGLLYERATGKKILHSFKNAVALSALIMFIGIGVLAFAKHPAMRSLGQVTVIGMLTVVLMAYYLPPLVFRFLTLKKGKQRDVPLTLVGLIRTGGILLAMVLWMTLLSILALFVPKGMPYHRLISRVANWAIHIIPGCPYKLYNPHGEDFSKPAVYICNHQSHLDVLALIALQPKLIFMTNDWVWNFPFYGAVLRKANYFPSSWGLSRNSEHVKKLVESGYSLVIFPEGTRSVDGSIQRFHRGAFVSAQELGLDILPLCLHGFHQALPKMDLLLRKAPLSLEIGQRISVPQNADIPAFTRQMRHMYADWYGSICRSRENAAFFAPWVKAQYLYKGHDAQAECRQTLRANVYDSIDALQGTTLEIHNAGCGVQALLTALTHPEMQITAYEPDQEKYFTACRCILPSNLTYING